MLRAIKPMNLFYVIMKNFILANVHNRLRQKDNF